MKRRASFAIVLVGKSNLIRDGIALTLRSAKFRITASVLNADDLLQIKLQLDRPLFFILHSGNDFDTAIQQIDCVRNQYPDGHIAVVTDHNRLEQMASAFRAGAKGYFVGAMTADVFIKSTELVMMGETVFPLAFPAFVSGLENDHRMGEPGRSDESDQATAVTTGDLLAPPLSTRENSILSRLMEGDSNKRIARQIGISEATVKVHVKAILRKIRVQNRTQAALWGTRHGLSARAANGKSPPSKPAIDTNKSFSDPTGVIFEIERIDAKMPPALIDGKNIQMEMPPTTPTLRTNGKSWLKK
jgi:DNA-binding NarL/FixJ family response regulator